VSLAHDKDEVIGMISINNPESTILVVSEKGYGKRTLLEDYRITNRGGKGVKTINVTDKTGELVSLKDVTDKDDLMIINRSGIVIRIAVAQLRVMGRATQGVRLITFKGEDEIASVARVDHDEEEELDTDAVVVLSDEELAAAEASAEVEVEDPEAEGTESDVDAEETEDDAEADDNNEADDSLEEEE
ncbi:MAG: DNA gyrase subunit A, partial [Sphingobacteriales bacterium]